MKLCQINLECPLLGKVPISENTNNIADSGTPLIDQNNSVTKVEIEKLINNIAIQLPPIIDETCTGRLAKVLRSFQINEPYFC